jgi:hypothetical protein
VVVIPTAAKVKILLVLVIYTYEMNNFFVFLFYGFVSFTLLALVVTEALVKARLVQDRLAMRTFGNARDNRNIIKTKKAVASTEIIKQKKS